ncbi:O-acyltransferase like protein-like isoform X1 [Lytechinus pictus]|uniref:O-acyltransferase like protein-like isoform X1 n=2 Tax=Lytechinus pictus TaxID=7653 RepID=UPI0030B9CBD7
MNFQLRLTVCTSVLILFLSAHCFVSTAGQPGPEYKDFRRSVDSSRNDLLIFKEILANRGLEYEKIMNIMDNDRVLIEYLENIQLEIEYLWKRATHRPKSTFSDDNVYIFEGENDDEWQISATCVEDVVQYYRDLINGVYYADRMRSSSGRIPRDALFTGTLKDLGNIWLCTSTLKNDTSNVPQFNGKYCPLGIQDTGIILGRCWPDSCSETDVNSISSLFWSEVVKVEPFLHFDCQERRPWTTADIGFTATMCFFALMVCLGSFYEVFIQNLILDKLKRGEKRDKIPMTYGHNDTDPKESHIQTNSDFGKVFVDSRSSEDMDRQGEVEITRVTGGDMKGDSLINKGFQSESETTAPVEKLSFNGGMDLNLSERHSGDKKPMKRYNNWAILNAIMMSFSIVNNCKKLLSARKSNNNMAIVNGLRVLSIFWVMLCHSILYMSTYRTGNPLQTVDVIVDHMSFNAVTSGSYSVDTFFVLSGYLVGYMTLKKIHDKTLRGAGSWAIFYFHRWWRLTPVYMAAMGIWALWWPHFGDGRSVMADETYDFYQGWCRKQWWTHPLYINNIYPWPNVYNNSCMRWSWYLACDMQFFIISPIILSVLYKNSKAGMALVTTVLLVSLGSLFSVSWYYGYPINDQPPYNNHVPDPPDADVIYAKPYTRIPPYIAGLILGYFIFKLKGEKVKLSKYLVVTGWILTLASLFAVVYGTWSGNSDRYVPQIESVIYLTFSRIGWGVAICWIIFACLQGYGGPVGVFLEWTLWIPLARLSYCIYLVHPIVMYSVILTQQTLFHFTYVTISYLYVGNVMFSSVAALILSLLVEGPFMGLEKVMFGKFKRRSIDGS